MAPRILVFFVALMIGIIVPAIALVFCMLSLVIVVHIDTSMEDIVGVVTYRGFPIWFAQKESQGSYFPSYFLGRFAVNLCIWVLFFEVLAYGVGRLVRKVFRFLFDDYEVGAERELAQPSEESPGFREPVLHTAIRAKR